MRYKNLGTTFFRFVTNNAFDRQTDREADKILIARPLNPSAFHAER